MPNAHVIREQTMRPDDSARCGAFTGVVNDTGHHLCALNKGHDGLHECDVCDITWLDPAVKPIEPRDPELAIIAQCVSAIEELTHDGAARVAHYLADRYPFIEEAR